MTCFFNNDFNFKLNIAQKGRCDSIVGIKMCILNV